MGRSFLRGLPSIVLVSCPLSLPASSDSAAVSGGEGEARATTTSIFTVGVSYPFSQETIILFSINEAFPDLETGCCCGVFLFGARALKYNKNYDRQAAHTKPHREVGGFTQKSSIFY